MNRRQETLPGIARANHSNRGAGFEAELAATHDWYRRSGLIDVVKNPSEWIFISEKEYRGQIGRIAEKLAAAGTIAETDNGRFLMRVPSDVDFSGGNDKFSVCFDAKETAENRVPLPMLKPHQIARLKQSARCGTRAGFMVKLVKAERVFFVPAAVADRKYEIWLKSSYGKKRAPAGAASLSLAELELHALEIKKNRQNSLWDWYVWLANFDNAKRP